MEMKITTTIKLTDTDDHEVLPDSFIIYTFFVDGHAPCWMWSPLST